MRNPIEQAVRGVGVTWVRRVHTYDMKATLGALREALSTSEPGPKVLIAEGECQLNPPPRTAPQLSRRIAGASRQGSARCSRNSASTRTCAPATARAYGSPAVRR